MLRGRSCYRLCLVYLFHGPHSSIYYTTLWLYRFWAGGVGEVQWDHLRLSCNENRATIQSCPPLKSPSHTFQTVWVQSWQSLWAHSLCFLEEAVAGGQQVSARFQVKQQSGFPSEALEAEHLIGSVHTLFPGCPALNQRWVINPFARLVHQSESAVTTYHISPDEKQTRGYSCNNICAFFLSLGAECWRMTWRSAVMRRRPNQRWAPAGNSCTGSEV